MVACAALDAAADAEVRRRAAALADAGLRVRTPPLHRPHLTLAAATVTTPEPSAGLDAPAVEDVVALAGVVAERHSPFALDLGHAGIFPGGGVFWLAPEPAAPLAALHADLDGELLRAGHERAFGPRSAPGRWVPHCTLATRLDPAALGRATELTATRWRPVRARVEALVVLLVGRPGESLLPLGSRAGAGGPADT